MSHWHGRGNRNGTQRNGRNSEWKKFSFSSPVLIKLWKNLCKINFHLKDSSLVGHTGLLKMVRNALAMDCVHPYNLSFCLRLTGFKGSDFAQCSLYTAPQWALWLWQRVQLYPLQNALQIFCALVKLAENMGSTPAPPWVLNFFSFHPSTFQTTTSRITRNSSKFLAFEVPMIPAGIQKDCLFFSLGNNVLPRSCSNASNQANERFVLTNQW
jgi:hypothetical protein